jgi:hypothetical protein
MIPGCQLENFIVWSLRVNGQGFADGAILQASSAQALALTPS